MDTLIIGDALLSSVEDRTPIAGLKHEIEEICRLFDIFLVCVAKSEAISVAHSCARMPSIVNSNACVLIIYPKLIDRDSCT